MPLSLYAAIIPNWLQQLNAVKGLLGKAEEGAATAGEDEKTLLGSRLIEDMLPLSYQFKSCWTHSKLALDGVESGNFSPHMDPPPETIAGCRKLIEEAIAACEAQDEGELESIAQNEMAFTMGEKIRMDFTVQDFLLSFSTPNLYFHAATAYDILRMKGVQIGKRDFLGTPRVKQA